MSSTATAPAAAKAEELVEVNRSILDDLIKATTESERQKYVIIPKTFEEAEKYADFVAKSQLLPKGMGKNEVFLIIQVGLELGLSPMQALKGMFCVNNRVSIFGDLAIALILRSGLCEAFDEDNAQVALKQGFGRCRMKRKGSVPCRVDPSKPEIKCLDAHAQKPRECCLEHRFSKEDAATAGLLSKDGPWKQYPGRMLQMRPRSWTGRDLFADVLLGMSIYEEQIDVPIATPHTEAAIAETLKAPKRKSEAAKASSPESEPLLIIEQQQAAHQTAHEATKNETGAPAPAAPSFDGSAGSCEVLIEKIEPVGYKDKESGKDKKFYKLTAVGGQGFATWSDSEADVVQSSISTKTPVAISWKRVTGKENLQIRSLAPVLVGPKDSEIPEERETGQEG